MLWFVNVCCFVMGLSVYLIFSEWRDLKCGLMVIELVSK